MYTDEFIVLKSGPHALTNQYSENSIWALEGKILYHKTHNKQI